MKRAILGYGHDLLRQKCQDIGPNYPELTMLVADMWETMWNASGCGLAAPQIGLPVRLFIIDSKTTFENLDEEDQQAYFDKNDRGITETFINAKIIERSEELWEDEEGCLSIPSLSYKVKRHWAVTIAYYDEDFVPQTRTFSGATARMVQHEYDHTEGILYVDYLKPITKQLMASKLQKIRKGQIKTNYPMRVSRPW